jgi:hypothetical protein
MKVTYPLIVLLFLASPAAAQTSLPLVEEVPFDAAREQAQRILKALEDRKAPFPAEVQQELRRLVREGAKEADAVEKMQKLLDGQCLCAVSINPESRVKAARGPATAELRRDRANYVLIKVQNDAGVTAALTISGPQLREGEKGENRWLEATVQTEMPLRAKLGGTKLEYVLVKLTPHESGKREATLRFDVGQGTQDLGFRAEVPILFTVR